MAVWTNGDQISYYQRKDPNYFGSSVCVMQCTGVIRDGTLIEKNVWRFLSIVFDLERTNQLNLLPDKDLVDLCHPIEP
jgi:hypothetical protein